MKQMRDAPAVGAFVPPAIEVGGAAVGRRGVAEVHVALDVNQLRVGEGPPWAHGDGLPIKKSRGRPHGTRSEVPARAPARRRGAVFLNQIHRQLRQSVKSGTYYPGEETLQVRQRVDSGPAAHTFPCTQSLHDALCSSILHVRA